MNGDPVPAIPPSRRCGGGTGRRTIDAGRRRRPGQHRPDPLPYDRRGRSVTSDIDPPWPPQTRYLRIGDLVVDLRYRRVRTGDTEADLPQRVFDLFLLLLAEPHALHSRTDLFQRLWPGLVVEDANLTQSMWLLRRALGESRKAWIRTVAKGGYVFEPPEPPQAFVEPPDAAPPAPAQAPADDDPAAAPACPAVRPAATRRRRAAWAGLGVLALVALAAAAFFAAPLVRDQPAGRVAATGPAALRAWTVVILEVKDDDTARWPRKLLREWLAWKLDSLPEVQLISEADFAAGHHGANTPLAIFVSSGLVDDAPGQMRVRVRFRQGAQDRVLEARGGDADLPARIDTLSRQVVAQLLPARAAPWPTLAVDASAARRYADAVDAIDRRDAVASTRILGEVIERSPRFGLARVQLAQAQKRLGLAASAIGEMDAAHALLRPAPPETLALFEAQRLSIDPKRSLDAANAFAALASGAARKPRIVLERARQLLDAGQPEHARALLSTPEWEQASLGVRITRHLLLSVAHVHVGDPQRARQDATTAERLARQSGKGWELERGMALVVLANVDVAQHGERADTTGFLDAAALFESAGNRTSALYARFLAASARPSRPEFGRSLDALLVQARASGYVQLEIEILMRVAGRHHAVGDMAGYRRYLEQALAGARVAGNEDARSRLETVLLFDAYRALHLDDADLRLQRLRASRPEGTVGMTLQRIDAGLAVLRGRHRDALDTLSADARDGDPDEGMSEAQLTLACDRADVRLQMGDLAGARTDSDLCASSGQPLLQMRATAHQAQLALLAGRPGETREALRRVGTLLESGDDEGPDRWGSTLGLAALLTRAGDVASSDRLLASIAPRVARSGIVLHEVSLLAALAENAAARGDWASARRHAASARRRTPPEVWTIHGRLALLEAADALARGDRTRAIEIATRYGDLARGHRDAIADVQFRDLLERACRTDCARTAPASRHGIRDAQIAWLPVPGHPVAASTPPARAGTNGQASRRP